MGAVRGAADLSRLPGPTAEMSPTGGPPSVSQRGLSCLPRETVWTTDRTVELMRREQEAESGRGGQQCSERTAPGSEGTGPDLLGRLLTLELAAVSALSAL